jgi:hypothetical protein
MVRHTAKRAMVGVLLLSALWIFASFAAAQLPRVPSDGQVPLMLTHKAKRVAIIGMAFKIRLDPIVPVRQSTYSFHYATKCSGNDLYIFVQEPVRVVPLRHTIYRNTRPNPASGRVSLFMSVPHTSVAVLRPLMCTVMHPSRPSWVLRSSSK